MDTKNNLQSSTVDTTNTERIELFESNGITFWATERSLGYERPMFYASGKAGSFSEALEACLKAQVKAFELDARRDHFFILVETEHGTLSAKCEATPEEIVKNHKAIDVRVIISEDAPQAKWIKFHSEISLYSLVREGGALHKEYRAHLGLGEQSIWGLPCSIDLWDDEED